MGFLQVLMQKVGDHAGSLSLDWEYKASGAITTNPTTADINNDGAEEILFGTTDGKVVCLSNTGKKLWEFNATVSLSNVQSLFMDQKSVHSIYSQPILINIGKQEQAIVFGSEAGVLTCIDHEGKKLWEFRAKGAIRGAPYAFDCNNDGTDEIVIGSHDKNLYVITSTGSILWSYEAPDQIESTAHVTKSKKPLLLFGCNDEYLYALSLDGKLAWRYKTDGKIHAQAVATDLTLTGKLSILIGSSDGHLYVLDEEGNLSWNYRTKGRILSRVVTADVDNDKDSEIFFGSCDDQIHSLAPNSQTLWTYETGFWVAAPVYLTDIDSDGQVEVIAGSYDKYIYVLEAKGDFSLDYMPGIAGIVQQSGNYSPIPSQSPGKLMGKMIWKYFVDDTIISLGILHHGTSRKIIVGTKEGRILCISHRN